MLDAQVLSLILVAQNDEQISLFMSFEYGPQLLLPQYDTVNGAIAPSKSNNIFKH